MFGEPTVLVLFPSRVVSVSILRNSAQGTLTNVMSTSSEPSERLHKS